MINSTTGRSISTKGSATKEKLLRIGLDQISVCGLSGVTLGQLASASGLSKSGLFAHFRSKEQLQVDLLNALEEAAGRTMVAPAMQARPGLPRLRTLIDLWFGWSCRAGLSGGCPLAAALFELDDIQGEVRSHVRKLEEQWRALLRQLVREAVKEGNLSSEVDVEQFVWELWGIYLSHHVSSRFLGDPEADARARRAFDGLVQRSRAAPAPTQSRPEL